MPRRALRRAPREHELLRERLARGPCFFTDLLAELDLAGETLREASGTSCGLGEATNDAWAPLRAPHLTLARGGRAAGWQAPRPAPGPPGSPRTLDDWPLPFRYPPKRRAGTGPGPLVADRIAVRRARLLCRPPPLPSPERRRALAELLLERYGIVTREQVFAEGIRGGFALLYDSFAQLETLGVCRRGYFIEGMGGAQFALPGAVERLRAGRSAGRSLISDQTPILPAARMSAAALARAPWCSPPPTRRSLTAPRSRGPTGGPGAWQPAGRPSSRVAGAYVVMVEDEPLLYVERGGRGSRDARRIPDRLYNTRFFASSHSPGRAAAGGAAALAEAVRAGRVGKLALERIDGQPAIASALAQELIELGFHSGPRKLTLSA